MGSRMHTRDRHKDLVKKGDASLSNNQLERNYPVDHPQKSIMQNQTVEDKEGSGPNDAIRTTWFRQERSCVDHIATLRIIIEQTIEQQTSLYLNVIDFQMKILRQGKRFCHVYPVLRSKALRTSTNQLRIFNTNVTSVLPYKSETWGETTTSL